MAFGMDFGELALVLIIVVIVFGSAKLPSLGEGLKRSGRSDRAYDEQQGGEKQAWTRAEWTLVVLASALGTLALALEILRHRH